jgi:hypothetical protein
MKQKEAVYIAVKKILEENGTWFEEGKEAVVLKRNVRDAIIDELAAGFMSGIIELDSSSPANAEKLTNAASLKQYCSGLVSNWLRKDTRLNGGVMYVSKKSQYKRVTNV